MVFDGRKEAEVIKQEIRQSLAKTKRRLVLGIIMVGESRASLAYVAAKQKAAGELGIVTELKAFANFDFVQVSDQLEVWAKNDSIDGILVQLPLVGADQSETQEILAKIPLTKDVDGLNPANVAAICRGGQTYLPATVAAVEHILHVSGAFVRFASELWAVIGAKGMVGKPLSDRLEYLGFNILRLDQDNDLNAISNCGVLISCAGVPSLITDSMVKSGAVVIDVGYPTGDVDAKATQKAGFITPVPGGVGPVTVVMLLKNLAQTVLASS